MIRFRNSLFVNRLLVLKSGGALYDENYHLGVNIIRGENASGKSTIADLIFFSLGGDLTEWTPEASAVDSVHVEVTIGGSIYTLSRDVETTGRPPLYIFEGDLNAAMEDRKSWLKYPPKRSESTDSFSQVLFRLLKFPEQMTTAGQNITIHQILRLLYCDQTTQSNEIFRHESFDNRDIRTAIGELMLGVDDFAMHDIRTKMNIADRQFNQIAGELNSLFKILGKTSDSDVTIANFEADIRNVADERAKLVNKASELNSARDDKTRAEIGERISKLVETLREVNEEMRRSRDEESALTFDIEDSRRFIDTIRSRIGAIDASEKMADVLGGISFNSCPACLTPVAPHDDDSICHLCKSKLGDGNKWAGHLKMREELAFQDRESTRLLGEKEVAVTSLRAKVAQLDQRRRQLSSEIGQFQSRFDPVDAEVGNVMTRIGYLDRSIEDLHRKRELAAMIKDRMAKRDEFGAELVKLKDKLTASEVARRQRWEKIQFRIMELCLDALHHDLDLEEAFKDSDSVEFDFGRNQITVNERKRFSASSTTYLKNAFLFSLFELSLEDPEVRWPRFILLDNIEDNGMQPNRSANFQEYVVERSSASETEHQVIMTTSMISEKLENSALCVGPHYSESRKSLQFRRS